MSDVQRSRPFVWGHRGASARLPENTLASFTSAISDGAIGVELDVRLCATGELVVFHDEKVDRLCESSGEVGQMSWQQLSELRISGQPIPLLSEVFRALPDAMVNVELKRHPLVMALPLVRTTIDEIRNAGAENRVLLSSFDPRLLAMARLLAPSLSRALLFHEGQAMPMRRAWLARSLGVCALHPADKLVTGHTVHKWQEAGYRVNVWTVDDPDRVCHLARLGVDAIITNDPKQVIESLEAMFPV